MIANVTIEEVKEKNSCVKNFCHSTKHLAKMKNSRKTTDTKTD